MIFTSLTTRSSFSPDLPPDCASPSTSPAPRNSRSACAISAPSNVPAITSRRLAASLPSGAREIRNAPDSVPPRPTRPRSWCNWDRPYRSASKITMQLACATSTPTSMTVVATRIGVTPASKSAIICDFVSSSSRPVSVAMRMPANCGSDRKRSAISATECNGGRCSRCSSSSPKSYVASNAEPTSVSPEPPASSASFASASMRGQTT